MIDRAHNPVSKDDIISFCKEHQVFFEELYQINCEPQTIDWKIDREAAIKEYQDWRRRFTKKRKDIFPVIKLKFNYNEPWGAVNRMLRIYEENREYIRTGIKTLSESDKKAIDEYSFQVPYDGSDKFYDAQKAKHFEAGIIYARTHK